VAQNLVSCLVTHFISCARYHEKVRAIMKQNLDGSLQDWQGWKLKCIPQKKDKDVCIPS